MKHGTWLFIKYSFCYLANILQVYFLKNIYVYTYIFFMYISNTPALQYNLAA